MQTAVHEFIKSMTQLWLALLERLPYVLVGIVVVVLFWAIGKVLNTLFVKAGRETRLHVNLAELFGRLSSLVLTVFGFFVAAVVVFPTFHPADLITGLGLTSVVLGFAFKDVLQNFFAGILLLWRQTFVVGDDIKVKDFEGTVVEITTRSTRIKTYQGTLAVIPNSEVYTNAFLVYTSLALRRIKFSVGVSYDTSLDQAREVILRAVKSVPDVAAEKGPWAFVSDFGDSAITIDVYFWTASKGINLLEIQDRVMRAVKVALDRAEIEIPFPQRVVRLKEHGDDGSMSKAAGERHGHAQG